ncbi:unnamed protein product, partial [Meganyctiphanes norvegica]
MATKDARLKISESFCINYFCNIDSFNTLLIYDTISDCGGELNASCGTIRHPLSGEKYQNCEVCYWTIRASAPINITFTILEIEESYDYLDIYDGETDDGRYYLGKFYGNITPSVFQASTGAAYMKFASDPSVTYQGFELTWELSGL